MLETYFLSAEVVMSIGEPPIYDTRGKWRNIKNIKGQDTNLAIVGFVLVKLPTLSKLFLHQRKDSTVRVAVVTAQIREVATGEGTLWTHVRLLVRQNFCDTLPEMSEQVNTFVPGFVDARLELFAAQLAAKIKVAF